MEPSTPQPEGFFQKRHEKQRLTELENLICMQRDNQAQETREEQARLYGLRKEYGDRQFHNQSHGTERRPETACYIKQPPIHGARWILPVRASLGQKGGIHHAHTPNSSPGFVCNAHVA